MFDYFSGKKEIKLELNGKEATNKINCLLKGIYAVYLPTLS